MATEVVVRAPVEADAPAIAEACNELSARFYGVTDLSAEEVRHWLSLPNLDTAVAELGGRICGYTDFRRHDPNGSGRNSQWSAKDSW